MSGDYLYTANTVSPAKCNEKPWDLWVSEIGHSSPRRDDDEVPEATAKGASRRARPRPRARRAGLARLRADSMHLHGLFPQMDRLNAAVCHMCGAAVQCNAAYRHLRDSHAGGDPILPPPPPAPTVKLKSSHSRSRHKKEPPLPPPPADFVPVKIETSPVHTATAPLPRLVLPQPEPQYLEEPVPPPVIPAELQVCMQTGELPVVSIQDTDDLHLGENLTDDIFAIMTSEGIQSADDIVNTPDWKNIMRDIGNMQDIHFSQPTDNVQSQDMYVPMETATAALSNYAIPEADLATLQFLPPAEPTPPATKLVTPKSASRSKSSKTSKFNQREYDPNKHCGVVTPDNPKPCTRSLTCKAHALSLRRTVEGRIKPFDTLLAEHRAAREARDAGLTPHTRTVPTEAVYNGLSVEAEEAPRSPPPAPAPPPPVIPPAPPARPPEPPDVCWYTSCPRPLALCTFNASHAGGAVTLGKKFATVRGNIKSSLTRSAGKAAGGGYCFGTSGLVTKGASKPEVRRLVWCGSARAVNGHAESRKRPAQPSACPLLDLGFVLDPLLDEKC